MQVKVGSKPKYSVLGGEIEREIYVVEENLKKRYEEGQIKAGLVGLAGVSVTGGILLSIQE